MFLLPRALGPSHSGVKTKLVWIIQTAKTIDDVTNTEKENLFPYTHKNEFSRMNQIL